MTETTLTKKRLFNGIWEGILDVPEDKPAPRIEVHFLDRRVEEVAITKGDIDNQWVVRVTVPPMALTDGIHTFLIRDAANDRVLTSFSVLAGEALADTLQAEVDLLRAELDLLKRAFRRHCVETT